MKNTLFLILAVFLLNSCQDLPFLPPKALENPSGLAKFRFSKTTQQNGQSQELVTYRYAVGSFSYNYLSFFAQDFKLLSESGNPTFPAGLYFPGPPELVDYWPGNPSSGDNYAVVGLKKLAARYQEKSAEQKLDLLSNLFLVSEKNLLSQMVGEPVPYWFDEKTNKGIVKRIPLKCNDKLLSGPIRKMGNFSGKRFWVLAENCLDRVFILEDFEVKGFICMEGEVHNISSFSGAPQILSSYQDKNKKFWLSRYDLFAQKPNCDQPSTGLWKKAINGRLTHLKGGQSFNGKGQKNNWLFYKEANNAKPVFALNDEEGEELILVRDNEGEELKNEALSLGAITALKFVNYKNGLRLYKSSTNFSDKINEILWIGFSSGKVLPLDIQADKGQRLLADFGFYSFFRSGRGDILEFYDFPHDESLYFIDRAGKTVRKFKIVNSILDLNQAYISME